MSHVLTDAEAQLTLPIDGLQPTATSLLTTWRGPVIGNQAKLEALLGRPLPAELFEFQPWGHRIVVSRDEPLKRIGSIHVPDTAQLPPARGTVISCGPSVGLGRHDYVGHCPVTPERLIGARVLFGAYAGQSLKIDPRDDEYLTYTVILTENEIWGLVGALPEEPLT